MPVKNGVNQALETVSLIIMIVRQAFQVAEFGGQAVHRLIEQGQDRLLAVDKIAVGQPDMNSILARPAKQPGP